MAQADYVVANGTGAAVRSDLNGQLAAIVSNNSGATEPATMYAYQWWANTTTGLLLIRNAANSAWVTVGTLANANLGLLSLAGGTLTGALVVPLASAATPSLTFTGDLNTGVFSPGAEQVAVATNGTQRLTVDTAATTSTLPVVHPLGAVGTPSITFTGDLNTGIYSPTADTIAFSEGGVEAMRIDSSGRLLVGTTTSVGGEIIQSHSTGGDNLGVGRFAASAGSADFAFYKSRSGTVGTNTIVNNADSLGWLQWKGADGTGYIRAAGIEAQVDGTPGTNDMPGRLVFSTTADGASSPTERMRISNTGTVAITGNQAGAFKLYVSNQASTSTDGCIETDMASGANSATASHLRSTTQGVGVWALRGNGASTWTSDERKKKNIEATRDGYLEDIQKLRVVKYNWKIDDDLTPKELGLIAQEVEKVFPGLVMEDEPMEGDDYNLKVIKASVIPYMLLKALQEAAEKIETLEARLTAAGIE